MKIIGMVTTGFGEGAFFVKKQGYFKQFEEKLGFAPFPGTLNLKLNEKEVEKKLKLETTPHVKINRFTEKGKTYCALKCWPCIINRKFKGAVLKPGRTMHPIEILEVIAPVDLRKELKLENESKVEVAIQ